MTSATSFVATRGRDRPSRRPPMRRGAQLRVAISRRVLPTSAGESIVAVACMLAVLVFEHFQSALAYTVVVAITLAGFVAAVRRVPLARWWTVGVVLGIALVRFS